MVYIDCGLKSCGAGIDRFRSLSVLCEIELFSRLHRSLCLCKDHTGRISCCLTDFWAAASPTLAAVSRLITCSLCVSVCDSTFALCPPLREARACVCERSVSCSRCAIEMMAWLSSACQPAACGGAGSPPVLLTSPLSVPFTSSLALSLPAHRKPSLMSG